MYLCAGCRATVNLVDHEYATRATLQTIRDAKRDLKSMIASINKSGSLKINLG